MSAVCTNLACKVPPRKSKLRVLLLETHSPNFLDSCHRLDKPGLRTLARGLVVSDRVAQVAVYEQCFAARLFQ